MANGTIKLAVEMESAELLRDIIAFLNDTIDAAGPRDGTAEALTLRSRLDAAVESGKLRIVPVSASPDAQDAPNGDYHAQT